MRRLFFRAIVASCFYLGTVDHSRAVDLAQAPNTTPPGGAKVSLTLPSDMLLIPAGSFVMGDQWFSSNTDARPTHTVPVDDFYAARFETTRAQMRDALNWAWGEGLISVGSDSGYLYVYSHSRKLLQLGASYINYSASSSPRFSASGETYPASCVTWWGAIAYCNFRSGAEGRDPCYDLSTGACNFDANGYRLPTEAEWEKAARGGLAQHHFPWSSYGTYSLTMIDKYRACFLASGPPYASVAVGSYPLWRNNYGLLDPAGNVAEWCWDTYSATWYSEPGATTANPTGPAWGDSKVYRGGSFRDQDGALRCAKRQSIAAESIRDTMGFRVVCREYAATEITAPSTPTGTAWTRDARTERYVAGGATSSDGSALEYQFDWGQGEVEYSYWLTTGWSGTVSDLHSWPVGTYGVRARARSVTDTNVVSSWSDMLTVNVRIPTTPSAPYGPTTPLRGASVAYTTSGGDGAWGDVEYAFDFSGETTAWSTAEGVSKTWTQTGHYTVKALARWITNRNVQAQSGNLYVSVTSVRWPEQPTGPSTGVPYDDLTFSATGAYSLDGDPLEYRFDLGDGRISAWIPAVANVASLTTNWTSDGVYNIKAQARSSVDSENPSAWGTFKTVILTHRLTPPNQPVGPYRVLALDRSQTFLVDGAACSDPDRTIEYRLLAEQGGFWWNTPWQAADTGGGADVPLDLLPSIQWPQAPFSFAVYAEARAVKAGDTNFNSAASAPTNVLSVNITNPALTDVPGQMPLRATTEYTFAAGGSRVFPSGSAIEYAFDWGDGSTSAWAIANGENTASSAHAWTAAGTYAVSVQARIYRADGNYSPNADYSAWSAPGQVDVRFAAPPTITGGEGGTAPGTNNTFFLHTAYEDTGRAASYRVDWGDGQTSAWSSASALYRNWPEGTYGLRAQARDAEWTWIESEWGAARPMYVGTITMPSIPRVYIKFNPKMEYEYAPSGAVCSLGHAVQYQVEMWTGVTNYGVSGWTTAAHLPNGGSPSVYELTVRARSSLAHDIMSEWTAGPVKGSDGNYYYRFGGRIVVDELDVGGLVLSRTTVLPGEPVDIAFNEVKYLYGYTPDHPMNRSIDFGDGSSAYVPMPYSEWPSYLSHTWSTNGTYTLTHRVEDTTLDGVVVATHYTLKVALLNQPVISSGPGRLLPNQTGVFQVSAGCACGHTLEYRMDWGDDGMSSWETASARAHAWVTTGSKRVTAQTRCATCGVTSDWSRVYSVAVVSPGVADVPDGTFLMGHDEDRTYIVKAGDIEFEWRPPHDAMPGHKSHPAQVSRYTISRYEVSNEELRQVYQWAYDQGKLAVDGEWVVNTEGAQQNLLKIGAPECQVGFSGALFTVDAGKEDFPCVMISWYGAMAYCHFRTLQGSAHSNIDLQDWSCSFERSDRGYGRWDYRLPTEVEWERAVRGGREREGEDPFIFPWTRSTAYDLDRANGQPDVPVSIYVSGTDANYAGSGDAFESGSVQTAPGGSCPASDSNPAWESSLPGGGLLYDAIGNVSEWCWDWYDANWYDGQGASEPDTTGPATGTERIVRGGSWQSPPDESLLTAWRDHAGPGAVSPSRGFRWVAIEVDGAPHNELPEEETSWDPIPDDYERARVGNLWQMNYWSDLDGDGVLDWKEWRSGTDPLNANSRLFTVGVLSHDLQRFCVVWPSVTGKFYNISAAESMTGAFLRLNEQPIPATPPANVYTDHVMRAFGTRYYRISLDPSTP